MNIYRLNSWKYDPKKKNKHQGTGTVGSVKVGSGYRKATAKNKTKRKKRYKK